MSRFDCGAADVGVLPRAFAGPSFPESAVFARSTAITATATIEPTMTQMVRAFGARLRGGTISDTAVQLATCLT